LVKTKRFAYILHLKYDIAQIKQGNKTITEHYGDLKAKWDELALYIHTSDLKAPKYEQICQFLSGFDPNYEQVQSQILLSKELSKLRAVVATLQRE
jgi:hypothetical protein